MQRRMKAGLAALLAVGVSAPSMVVAQERAQDSSAAVPASGAKVIYLAGQLNTTDLADKPLPANFLGQARAAFGRIQQTLKQSNADLSDIVQMTVFVTDVRNIPSFSSVVKEMYPSGHYPAMSVVAIKNLGIPGAMIEIQTIAVSETTRAH